MSTCISNNLSAFVNWQTGECSFDSESFITLLNFVKSFPAEFDWETYDSEHSGEYVDDATMMKNGQKLLSSAYLYGFEDYLYSMSQYEGEGITFVGYPSEDGTSNHRFSTSQTFAISTTCKPGTLAWNFLSQLVREDYQTGRQRLELPGQPESL